MQGYLNFYFLKILLDNVTKGQNSVILYTIGETGHQGRPQARKTTVYYGHPQTSNWVYLFLSHGLIRFFLPSVFTNMKVSHKYCISGSCAIGCQDQPPLPVYIRMRSGQEALSIPTLNTEGPLFQHWFWSWSWSKHNWANCMVVDYALTKELKPLKCKAYVVEESLSCSHPTVK